MCVRERERQRGVGEREEEKVVFYYQHGRHVCTSNESVSEQDPSNNGLSEIRSHADRRVVVGS